MKLFLGLFIIASVSWSFAEETNLSALERLENVFKNYDYTVRPSFYQDVPDKVSVTAHILSMPEIDSVKQEIVLNLYFRQAWKDPRLATNDSVVSLPSEFWPKIWQPDTFFVNELSAEEHVVTTPNAFVMVYTDGRVHKSVRYTLRLSCPMDFRNFPFDEQICELPIESYGHTAKIIDYHWEKNVSSVTVGEFSHEEFKILGSRLYRHVLSFSSGTYCRLRMDLLIRRAPGRYLTEFFYPCAFLAAVSLLSMFAFDARISVLISVLLVGFTILFLAIASGTMEVPFVAYSTALDSYSSITNTFVFLAFLANILTILLKKADSGPETFALSNLTQGRVRLTNDDEANLCSNAAPSRQHIPQNKLQAVITGVGNLLSKILVLIKVILVLCYILTNVIYWSTYPHQNAVSRDDLITNNWQVVD